MALRLLPFLSALTLCLTLLGAPSFAQAPSFGDIKYLTEEYYPYNYSEDGTLKGLSVDLLKMTWEELGVPPQPIASLPWARAYQRLQTEHATMLFGMARTPEREHQFLWAGPIMVVRFVLIAKKSRGITLQSLDDLKDKTVGTLRGDISDTLLLKYKPIARIEAVADMQLNIAKLLDDRLDMLAYEERSWHQIAVRSGLAPDAFETVFVLSEMPIYYAFHLATPISLVQIFQCALDRVKARPAYRQLLHAYLD